MKVVIDIGNTSATVGLFDNHNLLKKSHFNSTNDFIEFLNAIKSYNINQSIISSVVPELTKQYSEILIDLYSSSPFIINYKHTYLLTQVNKPETIGIDRLCNIIAVKNDYSYPAIIIDFGTATTYDVINNEGEFLGGAIATGIELSAKYLIDNAALLNKTNLVFPETAIGIDTTTNIQSGIMFGAIDQVEGMIRRIKKETNKDYQIILTGGFSKLISPKLKMSHTIDIDLTLKGIIYIYELNN